MVLHNDGPYLEKLLTGDWHELSHEEASGKFSVVRRLLDVWLAQNEPVVIFAESEQLLALLQVSRNRFDVSLYCSPWTIAPLAPWNLPLVELMPEILFFCLLHWAVQHHLISHFSSRFSVCM